LIGRTWYVNPDELGTHRLEKKRMSRIKAREHAHKSIEAHRVQIATTPNIYKNIDIQYEKDQEDLIPQTKKLLVQTTDVKHYVEKEKVDTRPTYVNRGEKVLMQGSVNVVDVTDGVIDDETTVLSPTAMRRQTVKQNSSEPNHIGVKLDSDEVKEQAQPIDFKQRLEVSEGSIEKETIEEQVPDTQKVFVQEENMPKEGQTQPSVLPYVLILFLVLVLSTLSIPLSLNIQYQYDDVSKVKSSYNFSLDKTVALLRLKI